MGLWADTFGGGNSFTESVANVFTPDDGKEYQGGSLVDTNTNKVISGGVMNDDNTNQSNSSVGSTSTGHGEAAGISGIFSNNNDDDTPSGMAPSGLQAALGYVSPIGIIGKLSGWANNLNPEEDSTKVVGGQQVYDNGKGFVYSYNFLGLPYEVVVEGDTVVDKLSKRDNETGLTGYETLAAQATANGNDDEAAAIMQEAEDNAQAAEGASTGPLSADGIAKMLVDSGVVTSNEEIQAMLADPKGFLDAKGINLSDIIPNLDPATAGTLLDPANPNYALKGLEKYLPQTVTGVAPVSSPTAVGPATFTTATASDRMNDPNFIMDAATGEIRDANLVDAEDYTLDMGGSATGINADGTVNETGEALNDYATQKFSSIIDTRTVAGKLMAQNLGEGNYVDMKSTVTGQLEMLADSFVGSDGEPKIPAFAQAQARAVGRTITFSGMTGTAATAAMATALMEASLPIAQQEAEFFQTLTVKNLDNKQQAIINKATVLSNFDLANLDARETAAVQNAQAFLEMDLSNLTNEQQAFMVNTQARVQVLLEDTQQENATRRFSAESKNDFTKFYTELGTQVEQFNANLLSELKRFNAGEINDATEFRMALENERQQFYSKMQYAVDESNARWRQTVATTNTQMTYDAAAIDTKNLLDISQEGLNRIWDRTDSTLDYLFKGAVTQEEFEMRLLIAEMQAAASTPAKKSIFDSILGGVISIASASAGAGTWNPFGSDARLKENIQPYDTLNGVQFYTWDWNDTAKEIGYDKYPTMGVIAQEVQKTHPDTVIEGPEGYLMVNYGKLKNEI